MKEDYEIEYKKLINYFKVKENEELSNNIYDSINDLLNIGGKKYREYSNYIETNIDRIESSIKNIAFKKMKEKSIIKGTDLYNKIAYIDDKKETGVIFCARNNYTSYCSNFENGLYDVKKILFVIISNPDDSAKKELFDEINIMNKKKNIQRITIKDFWIENFGKTEFLNLIEYINKVHEAIQLYCGFYTMIIPTNEVINKFKIQIGNELCELDYINKLEFSNIYKKQIDVIITNFVKKNRWKLMISDKNFAVSFITSEWYYKMYKLTENLDLTNIVCGYLKSIEQLLFEIIKIYKDKGLSIKSKKNEIILYTQDSEEIVDTTLKSLENALKFSNIFEVNDYSKKWILDFIDEWREKQRNGYFHKDNIYSINKVEEIREKAIILYFLILGSCILPENYENMLNGIEMKIK